MTIDTDIPSSGYPPEQLAIYKGFLRSEAYAVLGKLASDGKNWAEAETDLRKSIDALSAAGRTRSRYCGWRSRWTCRTRFRKL